MNQVHWSRAWFKLEFLHFMVKQNAEIEGHPTIVFCEISVRRSKNSLEFRRKDFEGKERLRRIQNGVFLFTVAEFLT